MITILIVLILALLLPHVVDVAMLPQDLVLVFPSFLIADEGFFFGRFEIILQKCPLFRISQAHIFGHRRMESYNTRIHIMRDKELLLDGTNEMIKKWRRNSLLHSLCRTYSTLYSGLRLNQPHWPD